MSLSKSVQVVLLSSLILSLVVEFSNWCFFKWSGLQSRVLVQGCSHAFDIGGAQASKIILGHFVSNIGGPNPTFTIV